MLKEILTARARPSDKALYNIWARKISGGWTETTITGTLPLTFDSRAAQTLTDYRIYGAAEGAGVETSGAEPAGYKIPLMVTSGEESTTTPIYIGDSKLMAEEYVDYESGKVYKRTENDFPFAEKGTFAFGDSGIIISDGKGKFTVSTPSTIPANTRSELIPLNRQYTIPQSVDTGGEFVFYLGNDVEKVRLLLCFYDANGAQIENWSCTPAWRISTGYSQMIGKTIAYIGVRTAGTGTISGTTYLTPMFSKNANLTTYIPYLQPTDPTVALPEISTYQGTNTLSSTETVGSVSLTGKIKEVTP